MSAENRCCDCGECREIMVRVFECADHNGHTEYRQPTGKKTKGETFWIGPTHVGGHDALMCVACLLRRIAR